MVASWAWVRSDLRRHWRDVVALVLLIGLSGAVVLTSAAGARRTDTAFDRLRSATAAADVRVQYSTEDDDAEVVRRLRAHPDVELVAPVHFTFAVAEDVPYDLAVFSGPDAALLRDVDRLRVIDGRDPAPGRPDEVLVNPFTAAAFGAGVGDTIRLFTFSPAQLEAFDFTSPPAGPELELRIVGIGRLPDDVASKDFAGIFGTPAFFEAYNDQAGGFGPSLEVLLRDGADPIGTVESALADLSFDELIIDDGAEISDRMAESTRVLVVGLLAFAAVAAIAALVVCGQAIHRRLTSLAHDQSALRAMGVTPRERQAAMAASLLPVAIGSGLLAASLAIPASTLMPIGRARVAEPHPGASVDVAVLAIGALTVTAAVLLVGFLSAGGVTAIGAERTTPAGRPSRVLEALRRRSSPATQIGLTRGLGQGRASGQHPRSLCAGGSGGRRGRRGRRAHLRRQPRRPRGRSRLDTAGTGPLPLTSHPMSWAAWRRSPESATSGRWTCGRSSSKASSSWPCR